MSNVVSFPTEKMRAWREIESQIKELLLECDASKEMIETIMERMQARFERCYEPVDIHFMAESPQAAEVTTKALNDLAVYLKNMHSRLMVEALTLEIELYLAKHGG